MTLLQTNAAINPGNSGGGLFNSKGELIGVVNAKSSGSDVEGLGFAIPIDTVKEVIDELMQNGYVSGRPSIGAELFDILDTSTARMYRVSKLGVYVYQADSDSQLQSGDLIQSIDSYAVESSADVKEIISDYEIGEEITISVVRRNSQKEIVVTIEEMME